jgi:HPt (histidine-containing phosphotransfer) domain-containing protein
MNYSTTTKPVLDPNMIESLRALGEGDPDPNAFLMDIVETYKRTTPEIFDSLLKNLKDGDIKKTVFFAHKLKGQSSNVGLALLAALCEEIEKSENEADFVSRFPGYKEQVELRYAEAREALKTIAN